MGCLLALSVVAQQDPVLMWVNGKAVLRSEFESAYHKSRSLRGAEQKTPGEYVGHFVDSKLKVAAAEVAGIDTTLAFRENLTRYRAQQARFYLTDTVAEAVFARQMYDKMLSSSRSAQVEVMHIFQSLPQTLSASRIRRAEARMDSIYHALITHPQPDFATFVQKYSDDKRKFRVERLQMPEEFENIVFSLQKGEISKPFFTPQGLHIVKLIDRKESLTFDEMHEAIERRLSRQQGVSRTTEALLQKLKAEYNYTPHEAGVEELLLKGETSRPLFTLNGQAYDGATFQRFAAAHPQGIKAQLNAFVTKTILDYEYARLEQKYPAFHQLMQAHKERMLLAEISHREVGQKAATDEAGLSTYFSLHSSDYRWTPPRYKGIVLHCADKKVAKQAKKLIKKLPEREWEEVVRKTFNTPSAENIRVEQGVFIEGNHAVIDKLIFKKGDFEPSKPYPFIVVWGEKQKGPDSYKEVRETLVSDYQNFLEALWTKRLRTIGKVEINQEVLKTVNNH